jgi:hypothetical protein
MSAILITTDGKMSRIPNPNGEGEAYSIFALSEQIGALFIAAVVELPGDFFMLYFDGGLDLCLPFNKTATEMAATRKTKTELLIYGNVIIVPRNELYPNSGPVPRGWKPLPRFY